MNLREKELQRIDPELRPILTMLFNNDPLQKAFGVSSFEEWYFALNDLQREEFVATTNGGDPWVVGVLMVEKDGTYYIVDVITFQKRHADRDQIIERVAKADAAKFDDYRVAIEKPSGPDGNSAFESTKKRLADRCQVLTMAISPGNKSKIDRATPLVSAIKYGDCRIIDGNAWKARLHTEFRLFPFAKHDDIVDGACGAMTALIRWANGKV